jgi:hypothetical protein
MAQTFNLLFSAISTVRSAGSSLAGVLVGSGSSNVLAIRRVGLVNVQTVAVAGIALELHSRVHRGGATYTGSTSVTATTMDTNNTDPTGCTYGHGGTWGGTATLLRRHWWSNDEPSAAGTSIDEWQCLIPLNVVFDPGYGDTNVQPLILRPGEGYSLMQNTTSSVANATIDAWIEFTKEA